MQCFPEQCFIFQLVEANETVFLGIIKSVTIQKPVLLFLYYTVKSIDPWYADVCQHSVVALTTVLVSFTANNNEFHYWIG